MMGAVETLIISDSFDWVRVKLKCQCGQDDVRDGKPGAQYKCPNCGALMNVIEENELLEVLPEDAKMFSTEVEIVSSESREGEQFKALGGIGAILRYKIDQ